MKSVILMIATAIGVFFLAISYQTWGENVFGQSCTYPGPCWHPEWVAVGAACLALGYYAWNRQKT
jgi:hypothetical protein